MEYYGIIFVKRIQGMPGTSPEPHWDPGDPLGTPLGPQGTLLGRPGTHLGAPGTPLGSPGTPLGPPRTSLRRPRDAPGTPRDPYGTSYGPLVDYKNGHISTNIQRQKLSIAAFEAAHEGPSHAALSQAIFSIKRSPK